MSSSSSPPVRSSSSSSHFRTPSTEESLAHATRILTAGCEVQKYPYSRRGGPSTRWIQLDEASQALIWFDRRKRSRGASLSAPTPISIPNTDATNGPPAALPSLLHLPQAREKSDRAIALKDITDIHIGRLTKVLQEAQPLHEPQCCWSITAGERTLDLAVATPALRDLWASSLARVLKHRSILCRMHIGVLTHNDAQNELALQAQTAILIASDPTNASGLVGLASAELPDDAARSKARLSQAGTVKMLEALVLEKEREIMTLKSASGNGTRVSVDTIELESRVKRAEESVQREKNNCEQEARARTDAQMKLAAALNEIAQLKATSANQAQQLEQSKRQLDSDAAKAKAEKDSSNQSMQQLQTRCATLERQLATERETASTLDADLSHSESALLKSQAEVALLKKQLESSNGDALLKSQAEVASLNKQLEAMHGEVTSLDEELNELQGKLNEQAALIETLQQQQQAKPDEVTTTIDQTHPPEMTPVSPSALAKLAPFSSSSTDDSLPASASSAGDSAAALTAQLVTTKTQLLALEDQLRETKHQLAQQEAREKKLAGAHTIQQKKKDETVKAAQAALAAAEEKSAAANKQVQALTAKATKLETALAESQSELVALSSSHAASLVALEQQHSVSEKALFEDLAKSTEGKIEKLRGEYEEKREEARKESAQKHADELAELQSKLAQLERDSASATSELEALRAERRATDATSPEFTPEARAKLEKDLSSTKTILSAQIHECLELEQQLEQMAGQIQLLEKEKVQLQAELARSQTTREELSLDLATSHEACRVLEAAADAAAIHELQQAEELQEKQNQIDDLLLMQAKLEAEVKTNRVAPSDLNGHSAQVDAASSAPSSQAANDSTPSNPSVSVATAASSAPNTAAAAPERSTPSKLARMSSGLRPPTPVRLQPRPDQ